MASSGIMIFSSSFDALSRFRNSSGYVYNSKNKNCVWALSFFKICSHIFMIFVVVKLGSVVLGKSKWGSDFGHAGTGS